MKLTLTVSIPECLFNTIMSMTDDRLNSVMIDTDETEQALIILLERSIEQKKILKRIKMQNEEQKKIVNRIKKEVVHD